MDKEAEGGRRGGEEEAGEDVAMRSSRLWPTSLSLKCLFTFSVSLLLSLSLLHHVSPDRLSPVCMCACLWLACLLCQPLLLLLALGVCACASLWMCVCVYVTVYVRARVRWCVDVSFGCVAHVKGDYCVCLSPSYSSHRT